MKKTILLFFFLLQIALLTSESRNALLIANSAYKNFSSLQTPIKEARDLKKSLETLGFSVVIVENASKEKMQDSLYDFQKKLEKSGGIGFFHYGGHAVQVNGKNYIIPADADIPDERRIASRGIDADEVMASMQADVNIVILDACRNNPLPASSGRSASRGLVLTEMRPKNSIIIYSAQPGKTAQDGVFTPILTKKILEQKSLTEVLMDVRREVSSSTGGEQNPGEYNELISQVYLAGYSQAQNIEKDVIKQISAPKSTGTLLEKGIEAFNSGIYSAAADYFAKAEKSEKSVDASYYLGLLSEKGLGVKQSDTKAKSYYKKAAKADHPASLFHLARYEIADKKDSGFLNLERSAMGGNIDAIRQLAYYYDYGFNNGKKVYRQDSAKARDLFLKGAAMGDECSMNAVGYFYYEEGKYEEAFEWFKRAEIANGALGENLPIVIQQGYKYFTQTPYARYKLMANIGQCYYFGEGTAKDEAKAHEYYKLDAAAKNDADDLFDEAYAEQDKENPNDALMFEYYARAAELGGTGAICNLGWCYDVGRGVVQDLQKAFELYQKAANAGNLVAIANVGACYYWGRGVQKNEEKAHEYYKKAAAKRTDADKLCSEANDAVNAKSANDAKGFEYWARAAELGKIVAEANMGWCYRYGRGVAQDMAKAVSWWEKSAAKGDAYSQRNLGYMYYNGYGTAKDTAKGIAMWKKAAAQGDSDAQNTLKSINETW